MTPPERVRDAGRMRSYGVLSAWYVAVESHGVKVDNARAAENEFRYQTSASPAAMCAFWAMAEGRYTAQGILTSGCVAAFGVEPVTERSIE